MELFIFDLDDTLFKTNAKVIVRKENEIVRKLSNAEYSRYKLQANERYDFKEFEDSNLFNRTATPIDITLEILKDKLNQEIDMDVIVVTARRDFDNKEVFLNTLRKFGIDTDKLYVERAGNKIGLPSHEAKKLVFGKYLKTNRYKKVTIYDDLVSNINALYSLKKDFINVTFNGFLVTENGKVQEI